MRERAGRIEALIVRPRDGSDAWVIAKGHIEHGEEPEEAAIREVREETGAHARLVRFLGSSEFAAGREYVRVAYYLMRWERDGEPSEDRESIWLPLDEAARRLTHENARSLARRAQRILAAGKPDA